ncbi:unnamed protein product [Periconia digitata]|uniref:Uncharacterized protein n=1 Tax=Periconia digitata TaxID=1303443 RepID=A0A9W4UMP7_9PLEO|nr:unnamed protein product [Periconia digitata]
MLVNPCLCTPVLTLACGNKLELEHGALQFLCCLARTTPPPEPTHNGPSATPTDLNALESICKALNSKGVQSVIWNPIPFAKTIAKPKLPGSHIDAESVKRQKEAWRVDEANRWTQLLQQGKWIIRSPPAKDEDLSDAHGLLGPWKHGDATPSKDEAKAIGKKIWSCPFLLQKFDVVVHDPKRFEPEVQMIYEVLAMLGGLTDGTTLRIVIGERCWPWVAFAPPMDGLSAAYTSNVLSPLSSPLFSPRVRGVDSGWSEEKVANLLKMWLVLEKEIMSAGAVDMLRTHWPLSHLLTHSAVEALRDARKTLMKNVADRTRPDGGKRRAREERKGDKLRRRSEWDKAYNEWQQDLQWQDEDDQELEEMLVLQRRGWWDKLEKLGAGNIVNQIHKQEVKGQKVAISFQLGDQVPQSLDNESETASTILTPQSVDQFTLGEPSQHASGGDKEEEQQHAYNDVEPFPHVTAISFPIPVRTLSSPQLLTYLFFLQHIILFATENPSEYVAPSVSFLGDRVTIPHQPLATGLHRAALFVGLKEAMATELVNLVENSERRGGVDKVAREERRYERGRRGGFEGISALVDRRRDMGRAGMRSWVRWYEDAGGFHVPRRRSLLRLLEASER